jgi:hypothetical protein
MLHNRVLHKTLDWPLNKTVAIPLYYTSLARTATESERSRVQLGGRLWRSGVDVTINIAIL